MLPAVKQEQTPTQEPILVISYSEATRAVLTEELQLRGVLIAACASFIEAERLSFSGTYSGVIFDLPSSIRARGEEKEAACSLGNIFPVLRAKIKDAEIFPFGETSFDKTLSEFIQRCREFNPRKARGHKRHQVFTPVILKDVGSAIRSFTRDVSWSGAFIVVSNVERYEAEKDVLVELPVLGCGIPATIVRCQNWGHHGVIPGLGVKWHQPLDPSIEEALFNILRTRKNEDRDRLIG